MPHIASVTEEGGMVGTVAVPQAGGGVGTGAGPGAGGGAAPGCGRRRPGRLGARPQMEQATEPQGRGGFQIYPSVMGGRPASPACIGRTGVGADGSGGGGEIDRGG